jgi:maltodextrin utilization protein YvdJ
MTRLFDRLIDRLWNLPNRWFFSLLTVLMLVVISLGLTLLVMLTLALSSHP